MGNSRFSRLVSLLSPCLVLLAAVHTSADVQEADWPGWRGIDRQGAAQNVPAPTAWSADEGLRWRTPVRGHGNSSPVVVGDRLYVTSAYISDEVEFAKTVFTHGLTLLALLIGLGAIRTLAQSSRLNFTGWRNVVHIVSMAAFASVAFLILFFLFFAPGAIDYERCAIRAWLGSSILVGLCVLMTEYLAPRASLARPIMGVAAIVFSVLVVAFAPAKEHAFRGGLIGASASTVWASALVPLLAGFACLLNYFLTRRRSMEFGAESDSPPPNKKVPVLIYGFLTAAGVAVSAGVGALLVRQRPAPGDETTWRTREVPMDELALWMVGALPVVLTLIILMYSGLRRPTDAQPTKSFQRSLVQLVAALLLAAGGLLLVSHILARLVAESPFLTYHLGRPTWIPTGGWTVLWVSVGLLGVYTILQIFRLRTAQAAVVRVMPGWFRVLLVVVAVAAFVRVNIVSNQIAYTRAIVCLDRATGETLWTCEGLIGPEGQLHRINSPATPTPLVSHNRVFAYFGYGGALCCDLDGNRLWENMDIRFKSIYGVGVSPIVYEDTLIIVNAKPAEPMIHALDVHTGKQKWATPVMLAERTFPSGNSRTPIILEINDRPTMLVWDFVGLTGYDPGTGEQLWHYEIGMGGEGDMVASLVSDDERVYCVGARVTIAMDRARLGKTEDAEAWRAKVAGANCASPILAENKLFFVTDGGIATCLDAITGERLWRERLGGMYYPSPVAVGPYVYFTNDDGRTTVFDARESEPTRVGEGDLQAPTYASFAPLPEGFFGRTEKEVFLIDGRKALARAD